MATAELYRACRLVLVGLPADYGLTVMPSWARRRSNPPPAAFRTAALPSELQTHVLVLPQLPAAVCAGLSPRIVLDLPDVLLPNPSRAVVRRTKSGYKDSNLDCLVPNQAR